MRRYLVVALLVIVAAAVLYSLYGTEQKVSLSDFKKELSGTKKIAIVMDTRYSESTGPVFQCGISIARSVGGLGKLPDNFAYEGETCVHSSSGSMNTTLNSSIQECESMLRGSVVFYIKYNSAKNATSFYKSKAVIEGDGSFLTDCPLASMIELAPLPN